MTSRHGALLGGVALALGLALFARAEQPRAGAPAWEYRLLSWDGADTLSALREVTGNEFGAPAEMLDRLSEGGLVPAADPALQAAIDRRLADRLSALGAEGWEAFWVREGETQLEGHLVPSPSVLLKRRR